MQIVYIFLLYSDGTTLHLTEDRMKIALQYGATAGLVNLATSVLCCNVLGDGQTMRNNNYAVQF